MEILTILFLLAGVYVVLRMLRGVLLEHFGIRIPGVACGLLAGALVRFPHGHYPECATLVAEFAGASYLFLAGLHLGGRGVLVKPGKFALLGLAQVLVTSIIVGILCLALVPTFLPNWQSGMVIGIVIGLSSSALILGALDRNREAGLRFGKVTAWTLVVQDLCVLPAGLVVAVLSGNGSFSGKAPWHLFGYAIIGIPLLYLILRSASSGFHKKYHNSEDSSLFLFVAAFFGLGLMLFAEEIQLSLTFGGLLAGFAVSGGSFAKELDRRIGGLSDFFCGSFFALLGLRFSWDQNALVLILLVLLLMLVKGLVIFSLFLAMKEKVVVALMSACALCQMGEFSVILSKSAFQGDIISESVYETLVSVALISMCLTPVLMNGARWFIRSFRKDECSEIAKARVIRTTGHVIILGLGEAAIKQARVLLSQGERVVVVADSYDDLPKDLESHSSLERVPTDAGGDSLQRAGVSDAKWILVNYPADPERTKLLLKEIARSSEEPEEQLSLTTVMIRSELVEQLGEFRDQVSLFVLQDMLAPALREAARKMLRAR